MRIDERLLGYRIRYPFLVLDYLLWFLLDFSKFKSINRSKIKKAVIIHTGAIGELVMISPIIKELSKQLGCKVDLMIKPSMFDLIKDNPHVNKTITYSKDFKENVGILSKEKYDLAVIFQASFKNALMCYKSGIKYRIGGFSRIKRFPTVFYTRRTFPKVLSHALDYSFYIVGKVGVTKPSIPKTEVFISVDKERSARSKINSKNYCIIHTGFGNVFQRGPPRFWQDSKYAEIADYLYQKKKFNIIFTGLKDQDKQIDSIISMCKNKKNIFNLAGKTDMQELCALIKNASFVLAPDTGASHIASSFGVPLVNLMDAPIKEWKPIGNDEKIINIRHAREIILFSKWLFRKSGGIPTIEVSEVKKAIDSLI